MKKIKHYLVHLHREILLICLGILLLTQTIKMMGVDKIINTQSKQLQEYQIQVNKLSQETLKHQLARDVLFKRYPSVQTEYEDIFINGDSAKRYN